MSTKRFQAVAATIGAAAVVGGAFSAPATAAPSTNARAGVCAGVEHCHRVATIDVDGDHRADRVGWHKINKNKVQIRVRTADGELLKRKVGVRNWPGGGTWVTPHGSTAAAAPSCSSARSPARTRRTTGC